MHTSLRLTCPSRRKLEPERRGGGRTFEGRVCYCCLNVVYIRFSFNICRFNVLMYLKLFLLISNWSRNRNSRGSNEARYRLPPTLPMSRSKCDTHNAGFVWFENHHIQISLYLCVYIYIYICIERERDMCYTVNNDNDNELERRPGLGPPMRQASGGGYR